MNPMDMMQIAGAISEFNNNHPKFTQLIKHIVSAGIEENSIIDLTVTKPDGTKLEGNMRVTASDLELIEKLKGLRNK